jgi:hypothetical protein
VMLRRKEPLPVWAVEEVHGIWWGYVMPRPEDKKFITHGRPHQPRILGPYYSREFAAAKVEELKDKLV